MAGVSTPSQRDLHLVTVVISLSYFLPSVPVERFSTETTDKTLWRTVVVAILHPQPHF